MDKPFFFFFPWQPNVVVKTMGTWVAQMLSIGLLVCWGRGTEPFMEPGASRSVPPAHALFLK